MQKDGMTIRFSGEECFVGSLDPKLPLSDVGPTLGRLGAQAEMYYEGGSELVASGEPDMAAHGQVLIDLSRRVASMACELDEVASRQPDVRAS